MRIVYLGSGEIGLPTLRALLSAHIAGTHELLAVVTQPDRPAGRGQTVKPGPIKALALEAGVPVLQPERLRRPEAVEALRAYGADVFVVFAYGQILSPAVLALAARGLPEPPRVALAAASGSRADPRRRARGRPGKRSGGHVHGRGSRHRRRVARTPGETARARDGGFAARPAGSARSGRVCSRRSISSPPGTLPRIPQDNALATYAPKLERQSGLIDWTAPARTVERLVYGMNPVAGRVHVAARRGRRADRGC